MRVGRIRYTNDLPIYAAFDAEAVDFPGEMRADVPAVLNADLRAGRLDVSPISAFAYLADAANYALVPDLCIGSRDAVWSVLAISPLPLDSTRDLRFAVTAESASGRNLLRILRERRYGLPFDYEVVADALAAARAGRPTLLIGDDAIDARASHPASAVFDLGALWHEWTGADMVYAVWAARRAVVAERRDEACAALEAFRAAKAWGAANPERVIAYAEAAIPRPAGFYAAYYRTLNFDFDASAQAGLRRFAAELHAVGALPEAPAIVVEEDLCRLRV